MRGRQAGGDDRDQRLVRRSPYLSALVGVPPKLLVGDQCEVDHLAPPRHVGLVERAHQPQHAFRNRLGACDADIHVARMLAVAPGAGPEQKDFVARVGDRGQADLLGEREIPLLERRAQRRRGGGARHAGIVLAEKQARRLSHGLRGIIIP